MSKLVQELADSLVLELMDTGVLDLSNSEKFKEFIDLLYEVLDKQEINEKTHNELIETHYDALEFYDTVKGYFSDIKQRLDENHKDLSKNDNREDLHDEFKKDINPSLKKNNEENNTTNMIINRLSFINTKINDLTNDMKDVKSKLGVLDKNDKSALKSNTREKKSLTREFKKAERRRDRKNKRQEDRLDRSIKTHTGKLWARFKKLLTVGILFIFAPLLKRIFKGLASSTESVWKPLAVWLEKNVPVLYDFLKKMASALDVLADLVLDLKKVLEFYNDNSSTINMVGTVGTMAGIGASLGSGFGPVGMLVGGLLGGGVGYLANKLLSDGEDEYAYDKEESQKSVKANISAFEKSEIESAIMVNQARSDEAKDKFSELLKEGKEKGDMVNDDKDYLARLTDAYRAKIKQERIYRDWIKAALESDYAKKDADFRSNMETRLSDLSLSPEFDKNGEFNEGYNIAQNSTVVYNVSNNYIKPIDSRAQ